jgi:hypothetical protein
VRRDRAIDPVPLAASAKDHVGLDLDPVVARGEDRRNGQVYRESAAHLHPCLIGRAINLCAGKATVVTVEKDIETIRRTGIGTVSPIGVDRQHIPSLASWHDKVISEIGVMWWRVGKCCRHCGIGPKMVVLIVKDYRRIRCARAVSPPGIQIRWARKKPPPDDHLATGPHCRVNFSANGRASGGGSYPTVRAGIVSPARIQIVGRIPTAFSAPDDHFAAGPHCRFEVLAIGDADGTCGCPNIAAGIIFPASVWTVVTAPDDHSVSGPDCRVAPPGSRRVDGAGGCPTVGVGIVSSARVHGDKHVIVAAPDDHFAASPDCCVITPCSGRVSGCGRCPTVRAGIVSASGVQKIGQALSAPDDHFAASPDRRVIESPSGRMSGAGCCPSVAAGIVSPASI